MSRTFFSFILVEFCFTLQAQQVTSSIDTECQWIDELNPREALDALQKIYWAALKEKDYGKVI